MKKAIGYVYVIAAAVCWGFLGLFNRVLTAAGVSLLNMMPLRFGGTAILFTVFCMMFKQQVFHIKLRHLPIFLGSGLISMLLVLCGCALVSGIVGSDVGISLEGLLMGLASELCYGGMRYCDSFTMAYWTFLIAGIASLFLADGPALLSALAEPRTGLAALGLMVMGTALPFTLYTKGLETVESGKAAIIANIEPVMSAVIGVTVFQETLGFLLLESPLFAKAHRTGLFFVLKFKTTIRLTSMS